MKCYKCQGVVFRTFDKKLYECCECGYLRQYRARGRKSSRLTRHHIVNKSKGDDNHVANILMLTAERHSIWHSIFKNLSIREVIQLLLRVQRIKDGYRDV